MRITKKGHDRIHTGEMDPATHRAIRFAEGEEFECLAENVEAYETRGFAVRVAEGSTPAASLSLRAAASLLERARDAAPPPWPEQSPAMTSGGRNECVALTPIDPEAISRLQARAIRDENTGCLVWQGSKAKGGYGQITYRRMLMRTHRLAWEAHHGPVPQGRYVCHACDNPACAAIEHLFLGTPKENYRDMRKKGRARYNAKLTQEDVSEIRARLAAGESAATIARGSSVRYDQILAIKNGRAWREI